MQPTFVILVTNTVSIYLKSMYKITSLLEVLNYKRKKSERWSWVIYIYMITPMLLYGSSRPYSVSLSWVLAVILGKHSTAPLIRPYKAKERNRALRGSWAYIYSGTMPNNTARSLRSADGSSLELDSSHVLVRSCVSAYP